MAYVKGQPFKPQFIDPNTGLMLSAGTIEFYVGDTTTPTPYYTDSTGTVGGTSLELDAGGKPPTDIFFDTAITYKLVLKNGAGTPIETLYPFQVSNTSHVRHTDNTTTYSLDEYLQNRHVWHLKDFGAALDGSTDDIAPLNAAKAAASAGDVLKINGPCLIGAKFDWDKEVILDFRDNGSIEVNSNITAIETDANSQTRFFICDTSGQNHIDVQSGARATHTQDLLIVHNRLAGIGELQVSNAGGRGIYLAETAGSNLNWTRFQCRVGGCGANSSVAGFELGSTQGFTECNAMDVVVRKANGNYSGVKIGGGTGSKWYIGGDGNTNEALTITGGAGLDVFLYDDSSSGARSVLSGGNGTIRGVFNNGSPDVTGNLTGWSIIQGRDYRYSQSDFVVPFRFSNDAANTSTEGFDVPFLGVSGAPLGTLRVQGDGNNHFKDATRWIFDDRIRYDETLDSPANDVYQRALGGGELGVAETLNLTTTYAMYSGFYEITMSAGRWFYGHIDTSGTVTTISKSASFGTSSGSLSVNIFVSGGEVQLEESGGAARDFTIRYSGETA